jgi:prolyl oligopeptidase
MRLLFAAAALAALMTPAHAQTPAPAAPAAAASEEPYLWLEEVEGERPLAWVRERNERSLKVLQGDPRYQTLHDQALAILEAKDRIAYPTLRRGRVENFWQDADNVRGVWRRTTLDRYRTADPGWETVLNVDALAKSEGKNWVYKGAACLEPDERRCLVSLSNGGKDAVEVREFDSVAKTWVESGFRLPEGKHRIAWLDADTILVGSEFGPNTLTASGYPFIIKQLKRGQTLAQATEVYRGARSDGGYGVSPVVLRDPDGRVRVVLAARPLDTFASEHAVIVNGAARKLPIPTKASLQGYGQGRVLFTLEEPWREFKTGALIAFDADALNRDPANARPELVFQPGPRESIEGVDATRGKLLVSIFENVKGSVYVFDRGAKGWTRKRLDLPQNVTVRVSSASDEDDRAFINVAGFLEPDSLWLADAATGKVERLKTLPQRFNAATHQVEQFNATSKDGTKIPYFVVRPKAAKMDGSNPVLLTAYGGFQVSRTPTYLGTTGKLWLEQGGTYVLANIRGGGEFGPAWHQAGLKANRQKVYDDFHAVAEDLIAKKITSPRRLGIVGGSNGGLLMGVALTQRPELWNAIVVQVPLFDMLRYNQLLAGASWMGEYGDPDIPAEREVIARYSPYQALRRGQKYPEVFILTSTKDDRVHPAHARKAAARLEEYGYPFFYYENTDGGHSAAANLRESAKRSALEFTYLTRKLKD